MRKILGKVMGVVVAVVTALGLVVPISGIVLSEETYARPVAPELPSDPAPTNPTNPGDGGGGGGGSNTEVDTSILPGDLGIEGILKLILNILVYGLGAAATLGVIIAGIMYMTARDNEAQVAKAKTRLYEVVIGLVAWALMYAVLNWLIPGGLNLG